jgi:ABC-type dipeptide/oligopeptide/nickel transport system permease subunit
MSEPIGTTQTTGDQPERERDAALGQAQAQAAADLGGRRASLWADAWRELRHSPLFIVSAVLMAVFVAMAAFPRLFTSRDPRSCDLSRSLESPSAQHWFGFDILGCDYYARVIYGARVSITIGVVVTVFSVIIAVVLGSLAGYYGGLVDTVIARTTDIIFGLPFVLGAIVILSVVSDRNLPAVSFVLIILGWTTMTRLMRSSVLGVRDMDYVKAAKALGATDFRLITRHVLPNAIAPMIVYATISVGIIISTEATLSFLGIGLQLPAISWGLMISDAQTRVLISPHLLFFPGVFLSLAVLCFILMGDALRDALDPKLR